MICVQDQRQPRLCEVNVRRESARLFDGRWCGLFACLRTCLLVSAILWGVGYLNLSHDGSRLLLLAAGSRCCSGCLPCIRKLYCVVIDEGWLPFPVRVVLCDCVTEMSERIRSGRTGQSTLVTVGAKLDEWRELIIGEERGGSLAVAKQGRTPCIRTFQVPPLCSE